ncbi:hypothetical protein PR202_gb24501 [Eleusine coracana subsp. coracana]|uniref:CRAL/TRIO N-terminal domain-containing protein n=1 Tax=Eleusine coracana subsp. coracana TaxID=191504 RepID=A0AAV5FMQ4_ELECO|nr:hypothetical protein PR202_gb24501 [Eleusine coracana subsp. coracana]
MPSSSYSQAMSYLFKTRIEATPPQTQASSEEQQRKIHEVRELLGDDLLTEMPSFLSDGTIRRFLRARNWNTEQATKAVKETIKWRRQYKPDEICWDDLADRENGARKAYLPDYLDKNGRKVFVTIVSMKILKHFIEPAMHDKVKFVYTKSSESQRIMEDLFDLDKLESVFGGRNTSGLDIVKYADRMRRQDQFRGCCKNINVNLLYLTTESSSM